MIQILYVVGCGIIAGRTICPVGQKRKESNQLKRTEKDLLLRTRELERELKQKEKQLKDEREKVEILKKSLHIFMQTHG